MSQGGRRWTLFERKLAASTVYIFLIFWRLVLNTCYFLAALLRTEFVVQLLEGRERASGPSLVAPPL
jgi:hypothetical protein